MKLEKIITVVLVATFGLATLGTAAAGTYTIDTAHSSVGFQIKHLAIAKVNGSFAGFEGTIEYEKDNPTSWSVQTTIQVDSIDTGNDDRDDHLRSPDFFDTEKFPVMTFASSAVEMVSATEGKLRGDLTMHGVTRTVELDLEFNGAVTDPWGNDKIGFSAYGEIDRKDWGLTFNKVLDSVGKMRRQKQDRIAGVSSSLA